jgi:hypothetical protein
LNRWDSRIGEILIERPAGVAATYSQDLQDRVIDAVRGGKMASEGRRRGLG